MPRDLTELRATLDLAASLILDRAAAIIGRLAPHGAPAPCDPTPALSDETLAARAARILAVGEDPAEASPPVLERGLHGAVERFIAFSRPQAGDLRQTLAILQAGACLHRIAALAEEIERDAAGEPARAWPSLREALGAAAQLRLAALRRAYRAFAERDVAAAEAALARCGTRDGERARMRDALRRLVAEPSRGEAALTLLAAFAAVERLETEESVLLELTSYTVFGQTFTERLAP